MKTLISTALLIFCCSILIFSQDTIYVPSEQPTIQAGIDAANDGDLVLVADGRYYENINYNGKSITVASNFLLNGDESHIQNTIIDGSQPPDTVFCSTVFFYQGEDTNSVLCGFTITGGTGTPWSSFQRTGGGILIYQATPIIMNNIIEENHIFSPNYRIGGSAMYISPFTHGTVIKNNIIRNNLAESNSNSFAVFGTILMQLGGGGDVNIKNNTICDNVLESNYQGFGGAIVGIGFNDLGICYIENNKISGNNISSLSYSYGGGIYLENLNAVIRNNIFAGNHARMGGGIRYYNSLPTPPITPQVVNNLIISNSALDAGGLSTDKPCEITNCIIWGNSSPQFFGTTATITYSDIEEAYTGVGNISLDPQFQDSISYLLSSSSPCIDAGNPDPIYNDVEDPLNPGNALWPAMGTLRNDIGHLGGPGSYWSSIVTSFNEDEFENLIPEDFALSHNYPNPFNPSTKINYSIPQSSNIIVKVFDILGNEIETLVNEEKPAGTYEITWYAVNLPSGVYFYQLTAGEFVQTKKMILLK